jgi:hypothetical protein
MRIHATRPNQAPHTLGKLFSEPRIAPSVNAIIGYDEAHCFSRRLKESVVVSPVPRRVFTAGDRVCQMNKFMGHNASRVKDPLTDRLGRQHKFVQFHSPLLPTISGMPTEH